MSEPEFQSDNVFPGPPRAEIPGFEFDGGDGGGKGGGGNGGGNGFPTDGSEFVVADQGRDTHWQWLIRGARADPEYAEVMDRGILPEFGAPRRKREPELNPEWERFGFRGKVAKLLFQRGLKRKSV